MPDPAVFLISIGGLLLLGLLTDVVGRRTALPRVTLLLLLGVALQRAGETRPPPAGDGA